MKVTILDGYNLIYRARHSVPHWQKDNGYGIVYSFFRSLRPLIEKLDPDKTYFVLEGRPKLRLDAAADYKGTRAPETDESFHEQKRYIINLMIKGFPIDILRHPDYECDDVIGHLVTSTHKEDECTVVSTDTDFIQLYNSCSNFELYNPIRKDYVKPPLFDYVKWKALRGDSCDNILGFSGIGDKRATDLVANLEKLNKFLDAEPDRRAKFKHNQFMIAFHDMVAENKNISSSGIASDWDLILKSFNKMNFNSITNSKSWDKFKNTFSKLEK